MVIANKARGEVAVTVAGGEYTLCLSLGALARIETALELDSLEEFGERMSRPRVADLLAVFEALAGVDLDADGLPAGAVEEIAAAITAAVEASGMSGGAEATTGNAPARRKKPRGANGSKPVAVR